MVAGRRVLNRAAFFILGFISSAVFAASAGTVTHLSGTLSAQGPDGAVRALSQKSAVNPGDTLTTQKDSYAQINFTDGSSVTLRPNSSVKVETYRFAQEKPQDDSSFLRLLKGGLRTVTGLIGRRGNQDAYKIGAQAATIGIRGSSGDTLECSKGCPGVTPTSDKLNPGLYHATYTGGYILQNKAGSQTIGPGQFGFVRDAKTPPEVRAKDPGLGLSQLPFALGVGAGSGQDCVVR